MVAIGADFEPSPAVLEAGVWDMFSGLTPDAAEVEMLRNLYVMHSPDGADHWPVILEHTSALYRAIPRSELAVVSRTSHAVVIEKPDILNRLVLDFLQQDPIETMLPVRRAVSGTAAP